jgi:hypothetical protein
MFSIGAGELIWFIVALIGGGWALLTLSFKQFEKRLENKFEAQNQRLAAMEAMTLDIKRLEIEIVKRDSQYIPRSEVQVSLDRVFSVLRDIDMKLDKKADKG